MTNTQKVFWIVTNLALAVLFIGLHQVVPVIFCCISAICMALTLEAKPE